MTSTDRRERMRQLLLVLQNAEREAGALGLPSERSIRSAKVAVGWEIASQPLTAAGVASQGERDK